MELVMSRSFLEKHSVLQVLFDETPDIVCLASLDRAAMRSTAGEKAFATQHLGVVLFV